MVALRWGWLRRGRPPRRLPGAIVHRSMGTFLKFSPLPSKQRPAMYTGAPRWPATDMYYRGVEFPDVGPSKPPRLSAVSESDPEFSGAELWPVSVQAGDAVETICRDGQVQFGIVTFSVVGPHFDMITLEGDAVTGHISTVAFVLRGVQPPSLEYHPETVRTTLQTLVAKALAVADKVAPYMEVVHAQLSVPQRARAVSIVDLSHRTLSLLHQPATSTLSPIPVGPEFPLGVYFAASYNFLGTVRLRGSPFALVSVPVLEIVYKVMRALTQHELDVGAGELRSGRSNSSHIAHTLRVFLEHFALWGDSRLERAALAIVNRVYPERPVEDGGGIAAALQRLLGDFNVGSVLEEDLQLSMVSPTIPHGASPVTSDSTDQSSEVASDKVVEAVALSEDLAVSVEPSKYPTITIHIPQVPVQSVLGSVSTAGIRGRTAGLSPYRQLLIPMEIRRQWTLVPGQERTCLGVSASVDPSSGMWEPSSVSVQLVRTLAVGKPGSTNFFGSNSRLWQGDWSSVHAFLTNQPPAELSGYETRFVQPPVDAIDEDGDVIVRCGVLAGQWAAAYASQSRISVPYLVAKRARTYPEPPREAVSEHIAAEPAIHDGVGTSYISVAWPLDSALALVTQRQLLEPRRVPPALVSGAPRLPLATKASMIVWSSHQLASVIEQRQYRQHVLRRLQHELQTAETFHLFRCKVLHSPSTNQTPLARAWCRDLDLEVEVWVLPHTRVFPGDQVLCTEILELDPLQGLFVLSM